MFNPQPILLSEVYKVGFSLRYYPELDRVLPQAFIVPVHDNHKMMYYVALAKIDTIPSYGIDMNDSHLTKAIQYTEELSPLAIEQFFNKSQKKKQSLQTLFLHKEHKKILSNYINVRMNSFLELCFENQWDICWNLERKMRFEDGRMVLLPMISQAILCFDKTVNGVLYSMKLDMGEQQLFPSQIQVKILNEFPAWVSAGNKIFRIEHLNAVKLKPFLSKESTYIPKEKVKEFFEKFVLENLYQSKVETTGFHIEHDE
ncbi:MAG: hypothetical protein WAT79_03465, partial [Saprospiraceae bacterium]